MSKSQSRTLQDLRMVSDRSEINKARARDALARMRKTGREHWLYEREFLAIARISHRYTLEIRAAFEAHVAYPPNVGGRGRRHVWFGDARVAAKMRQEIERNAHRE